jgi:hypothetical protein
MDTSGQNIHGLLVGMLFAIGKVLQERAHETLEIWYRHLFTFSCGEQC